MPEFQPDKFQSAFRLTFEGAWPTGVAFLDGGHTLAAGNRDGRLLLWRLPKEPASEKPALTDSDGYEPPALPPYRQLVGHTNGITRLLAAPDGQTLISGSLDHTIRVWDTAASAESTAEIVIDSRTRQRKAERQRNQEILKQPGVEVETQSAAHTIAEHEDWIGGLGLSRDGRRLISGDDGGLTVVRDFATGEQFSRWTNGWPGNWITSAALSPDGKIAFTAEYQSRRGDFDRPPAQARFFDAEQGSEILDVLKVRFPDVKQRDNSYGYSRVWGKFIARGLIAADFSPDGKLLCAGQGGETGHGKVHLIEVESGKLLRSVADHRYGVTDCRFSPDGRHVLSTGRDTTLQICRVEDGKEVAKLGKSRGGQFKDWLYHLALSADGRRLAATDIAGLVHVWQAAE